MGVFVGVEKFVLQALDQVFGDKPLCILRLCGRRHGGNDVIEKDVIFVIVDDEDRLTPDPRICGECFEHRVYIIGAIAR